jgi:hypothetical protein
MNNLSKLASLDKEIEMARQRPPWEARASVDRLETPSAGLHAGRLFDLRQRAPVRLK